MIRAYLAAARDAVVLTLVGGLLLMILAMWRDQPERYSMDYTVSVPDRTGYILVDDPSSKVGYRWVKP